MNILVSILVSNIVSHDNAMSSLVERVCDRPIALLTSSVPDLQFNFLTINFNSLYCELESDGGLKVISELIIGETLKEARFTSTR